MTRFTFDLSMSLDGYVAGPEPSQKEPLGKSGESPHEWAFSATHHGRELDRVVASPAVTHLRYRVAT